MSRATGELYIARSKTFYFLKSPLASPPGVKVFWVELSSVKLYRVMLYLRTLAIGIQGYKDTIQGYKNDNYFKLNTQ